jgi:hypothetical protein
MTPLLLETLGADGAVLLRTPLVIGVTLVQAQPGVTYRVINDLGGRVTHAALVQRVGDDLKVDLPQDRNLSLEGFFTRCTPADPCALSMENIGGVAGETVTPATPPVAQLADGGLLMYASGAPAAASPASESAFSFKPLIGIAGGVAILGAAGGGGGGGGSSGDSTPPPAPELTSSAITRLSRPVFSGTAEAGAKITLTLFDTNRVTYETTVASDGTWRIDTAVATPLLGTPITLVEGVPVPLALIATDAAGNPSPITSGSVTLDSVALAAPVITSPLLTQDTTPVIRGTAEPGSRVAVGLDLDRNGTIDATWVTTAQGSGEWAVDVGTPPASGALPGGQLANLSSTGLVVTASDDAGNLSPSTTAVLQVNTSLPAAPTIDTVAGDNAVNALEAGASVTVTGTVPEAVSSVTVSWGTATVAATVTGNTWTAIFTSAQVPADGSTSVLASYVSAGGATSAEAARAVLVDRLAPGAPTITQVPENGGGGINAVEAADGTVVRIGLGGTGAVAGDRIVLQWGGATVTHTITGTEIGGNVATVNVSAATIGAQGDGSFGIVARIVDLAGNEGASSPAFQVTVDRTAPAATARVTAVTDDAALFTGLVPGNGLTNDASPTISGTLSASLAAGETVEVLRNGQSAGFATVSGTSWSFADSGLSNASYSYTARVVDGAGNRGVTGSSYTIRVDTAAPSYTLRDFEVEDDVRPDRGPVADGGTTNDTRPELTLRLDSVLSGGDVLRIYRATGSSSPVLVREFERRDDDFSFTDGTLARGNTYTYTADVVDTAGNVAPLSLNYSIVVI